MERIKSCWWSQFTAEISSNLREAHAILSPYHNIDLKFYKLVLCRQCHWAYHLPTSELPHVLHNINWTQAGFSLVFIIKTCISLYTLQHIFDAWTIPWVGFLYRCSSVHPSFTDQTVEIFIHHPAQLASLCGIVGQVTSLIAQTIVCKHMGDCAT